MPAGTANPKIRVFPEVGAWAGDQTRSLGIVRNDSNLIGETVSWNQVVVGVSDLLMLAQAAEGTGDAAAPAAPARNPTPGLLESVAPMIGIGILFYFIVMRPQLKAQKDKRKQHEDLMANLKKNDKVVTIGGIIGTVAEVTDDSVTLKIDDTTRMKFTRASIQEVVGDKSESKKDDSNK